MSSRLGSLLISGGDLSAEDNVPELAGDTETQLVVFVVVLQVGFFDLLEELRQLGVMQDIMGDIVHDVAQSSAGKARTSHVEWQKTEHQLVEWICQNDEQRWGQNQTISVHRQVMVDTMQEEVESQEKTVVGQVVVQMEQESVQAILYKGPHKQAHDPETERSDWILVLEANIEKGKVTWKPHGRDNPPCGQ